MMHYAISMLLNETTGIRDDQLLIGGLAPDVHKHMNEPKAKSHFAKVDGDGAWYTDYEAFGAKYFRTSTTPFHLGYYYHLISDQIWMERIYNKQIKWLPQPEKKQAQAAYYRDFWRLNGKLIDHYSLRLQPLVPEPAEIDEIDCRFLQGILNDLAVDFMHQADTKDEPLEILHWDEVIDVLDHTVRFCKQAL
jgi:hypothetical protein